MLRGSEPPKHGKQQTPFARDLITSFCADLLHEFRIALGDVRQKKAREKETISKKVTCVDCVTIKMHDCEVIAAANARHFYILVNEKAVNWIQTGLRRIVKDYLGVKLQAMSHTATISDGDQPFSMIVMKDGVRDKIMCLPKECAWNLKCKGEIGADTKYCEKNNMTFSIPSYVRDDEFLDAREKAFIDACTVWNAVDTSGRRRIKLPERRLNVKMVPVLESKAMSHTESDGEFETN